MNHIITRKGKDITKIVLKYKGDFLLENIMEW